MVAFGLARVIGGTFRDYAGRFNWSVVWTSIWLQLESSVAVLMGGVTAFRTVLAQQAGSNVHLIESSGSSKFVDRVKRFLGKSRVERSMNGATVRDEKKFLDGPLTGASLKGFRTFIRRNGREQGHTTVDESFANSIYDPIESYHHFKKHEHVDSKASSGKSLDSCVRTFDVSTPIDNFENTS